jgi:N-acetylneuraminic acid mutarotase
MIVWGGRDATTYFNTGGQYDPVANSWSATTTTDAPGVRGSHVAVWTGSKMIIWGGGSADTTYEAEFHEYNPSTNTWLAKTSALGLIPAQSALSVWTGTKLIVTGAETFIYTP